MPYTLPDDCEALDLPGQFYAHSVSVSYPYQGTRFTLLHVGDGGRISETTVADVRFCQLERLSIWGPPNPEFLTNSIDVYGMGRKHANGVHAFAMVLEMAARFTDTLNEADEPAIAKYKERLAHRDEERAREREQARAEKERRMTERRAAQEEADKRRAALTETFQWYVGQMFKLRRRGYKSTVFGTVNEVRNGVMYTTSEKQIPMQIFLSDVTEFHVKYEGEKRYTQVYSTEEVTA